MQTPSQGSTSAWCPPLTSSVCLPFWLGQGRRRLLWFVVTRHPTAEWLARQIVQALGHGTKLSDPRQ
jgi:hypothetical protein